MVIRTFFDKSNTIISNSDTNTGLNPVTELFYGGSFTQQKYSRFLFYFDESRIKSLYTGGTFTDLTKLKHTLKLTNTASFDKALLNGDMGSKDRATSFDLILFKINQEWDNGVGYDYDLVPMTLGNASYSNEPSNWISPQTGIFWDNGNGVYSGSPSGITISTQHFDKGNENIEMDISEYVNGLLTGDTNYGLGIAYAPSFEELYNLNPQYVGFFTNNTQTFYQPFVETINEVYITDNRNDFYLDKLNKLYLYVNTGGNPTNLDNKPSVNIYDANDVLISAFTSSAVTHVTKGVYSIDLLIPTTSTNVETMFYDVWSGITINGVTRPNITLNFVGKDSNCFYNIGDSSSLTKQVAVSVSGIRSNEKIKKGDVRRLSVSARIPYTVEQTQNIFELKYRLYVLEGQSELTVIDYQPFEMASNYYTLIDTASLIPNTYFLDIQSIYNQEVTTLKDVLNFDIVNQSESRKGQ